MARKIIIDCERLKYPHTGLHSYCINLVPALQKVVQPNLEELSFFLPKEQNGAFGKDGNYLFQHSIQKLIMPSLKKYSVWHSTHQDSDYYPLKNKLPVVLTIHDINVMHNADKSPAKKKRYIKQVEKKIRRADHVTFISNFTSNDVQQYIDLANKPNSIVYNGCTIHEIQALQVPAIKPAVPFYFTISTIMKKKNTHVLPALLAGNDRLLVIAGITSSESYKQEIIAEAVKHGVEKRLIFTGAVTENDKQWYLKNCTAFLFPSLTEGFGAPVVEAMYFGVPIFLSRFTSLPEIGGEVCYYFSSFEKDAMQKTVQDGLLHYKENVTASELIRKRAAMFNWQEAAGKYLEVYRSLY
jgi:glycosyltransferase involved in cell wall biosynthesis